LRICDLVLDPIQLLAITALIEARLWQLTVNPDLDPLVSSQLSPTELVDLADANETAAARSSLNATLRHWQDGREIIARDWIEQLYNEVRPYAKERGFSCFLSPVKKILSEGNSAIQWLERYDLDRNCRAVITEAIATAAERELELADKLCQSIV
jgi:predicted glutamate--cysteine ligase